MQPEPTNQSTDIHPDKAMASLAFSTHLLNQFLEHQNPTEEPQTTPQEPQDAPQPTETQQEPQDQQTQPEAPDTSEIDQKIQELESNHEKEIMMLKHELEVQGIKQGNDKKVAELEKKHKQEIEDLRTTVKTIING